MAKYIIAHDVGTTNNKAVLVGLDGLVYGKVLEPYDLIFPKPGWVEQNPEDWWRVVAGTTKRLMEQTKVSPSDILCITFATQMLGIVALDEQGIVLRPGIIWMDGRAPDEAKAIMNKFLGPAVFAAIAGAEINGKDAMPKLIWLKKNEPDLYKRMKCFLDICGYLKYRCTGKMSMDWNNASGFGLDLKKKEWLSSIFAYVGFDTKKLPPLTSCIAQAGVVTREAAEQLGLLQGTPVMGGAGDTAAAATGSGAVGEGEGHISMGTSSWVGVVTRRTPTGKAGIATITSAEPQKSLLLAQSEMAGGCLKWMGNTIYKAESQNPAIKNIFAYMDETVQKVPAGADYLIYTPWMAGERSPVADTFVRSSFFNLTTEHTREQILRAVYEGVAYNIRWVIERIEKEYKFPLSSLRVIGGGGLGHPWMQIIADVTGKIIEPVRDPQEAGAVGVAMAAAVGLGIFKDFESLKKVVAVGHTFEPRTENRQIYDVLFPRYKEAYADLKGFYERINRPRSA